MLLSELMEVLMELHEFISKEHILLLDESGADKFSILQTMLDNSLSNHPDMQKHRDSIWRTLQDREKSMSTGIGLGVAIPHCSTEHVADVQGVIALLKNGVDFQAVDDEPVRIIVLLLLPKNKFEKHIKTLASIAKMFNDESFRKKILSVSTSDEAYAIVTDEYKNQHPV